MKKRTVRKIIKAIKNTVFTIFGITLFLLPNALGSYIDSHYNIDGVVVSKYDEIAVIESLSGKTIEWDAEGLEIGQNVLIKMYNGHTMHDTSDDEIVSIRAM